MALPVARNIQKESDGSNELIGDLVLPEGATLTIKGYLYLAPEGTTNISGGGGGGGSTAWADITGKPTTIAGYGITDPVLLANASYSDPIWLASVAFSKIQAFPTNLTAWASVNPATQVPAATQTAINAREPAIATGTTSQFWRGDKTWQAITKANVGLANVDNTSDANKPVSTAMASALASKESLIAAGSNNQYWRGDKTFQNLDRASVGLSDADNTSDLAKPISTATQTALDLKANTSALGYFATGTDATNLTGTVANARTAAFTGDVTKPAGSGVLTLPTVNANVGTFGSSTSVGTFTVNAKGQITAASNVTLSYTWAGLSGKPTTAAGFGITGGANLDLLGVYTPATLPLSTAATSALAGKESTIGAGTTGQYWRGDKTWQTLDRNAVGLGNVDNTTDLNKPVSTATQTALNGKENAFGAGTTSQYLRGDKSWQTLDKTAVGLPNVDNTSDANKPVSIAQLTALNGKQDTLSNASTLAKFTESSNLPLWNGSPWPVTGSVPAVAGIYTPSMFGGIANWTGSTGTDNTNAFRQAMAAAYTNKGHFRLGPGNWRVTDSIEVPANFQGTIDFGGMGFNGTGTTVVMDFVDRPFLIILGNAGCEISNLTCIHRPANGNYAFGSAVMQTGSEGYTFKFIGLNRNITMRNVFSRYGSGIIRNCQDLTNYPSLGTLVGFYNFSIDQLRCSGFGRTAIWFEDGDTTAGNSGSVYSNMYLSPGAGNTNIVATSAIKYEQAGSNEVFDLLNIEWGTFSEAPIQYRGGSADFNGLHFEGVALSNSSAKRDLIDFSNCELKFTNCRFSDLRADKAGVTHYYMFNNLPGFSSSIIHLDSVYFSGEATGAGAATKFMRWRSATGGPRWFIDGIQERPQSGAAGIVFDADSPSWYGLSENEQPSNVMLRRQDHFITLASSWVPTVNLSPAAATVVVSPVTPSVRPGALLLQSGTVQNTGLSLQLPLFTVNATTNSIRMKFGIMIDNVSTGAGDDIRFYIGLAPSGFNPVNTPTDFIGITYGQAINGDNKLSTLVRNNSLGQILRTLRATGSVTSDLYFDIETTITPGVDFANLVTSWEYTANGRWQSVSCIPYAGSPFNESDRVPNVDLVPTISIQKRGAGGTNQNVYVDYFDIQASPNNRSNR